MADLFNFAWDRKKPDWMMNRDDAIRQAYGVSLAGGQGQQADQIAAQMRGFGDNEMQQAATLVDQNMGMGMSAGDAQQQVASSMPNAPKSGGIGNIDFKALATALSPEPMEMLKPQVGTPKAPAQIQPIMIYCGQPAGPSGAMQAITGMGRGQASEEELRRLRGY